MQGPAHEARQNTRPSLADVSTGAMVPLVESWKGSFQCHRRPDAGSAVLSRARDRGFRPMRRPHHMGGLGQRRSFQSGVGSRASSQWGTSERGTLGYAGQRTGPDSDSLDVGCLGKDGQVAGAPACRNPREVSLRSGTASVGSCAPNSRPSVRRPLSVQTGRSGRCRQRQQWVDSGPCCHLPGGASAWDREPVTRWANFRSS